ncbi:NDR1/HIN1-like protein 26 [Telopea speciosissima]|uniref:NDR1/HIN1-like protein 26 n=1 Tax=Telopea speciosissima TaxID=54955 RepID=UPI001CC4C086|nr:NDR1/HIN1-like protein 26 [Telopea speciosissima]
MTTRANVNGEHRPRPSGQPQHQNHHHPQGQGQGQVQQNYYPHPNYASSSSSAASFKGCCCCLFLLLTFLGLLVLAVVLVIVLAVKPKKPQFDLQQVSVQYVGITTAPASQTSPATSASLSLSIRMLFTAVNPNKVGIKYGESKFYVMYKGVPLGVATMPGFYQPSHSVRQVETTVVVDRINLLQTDAEDLVKDASLNDRVELKVMGDVGAKIRVLQFTSPRVQVTVNCIVVISPRKQSLTYKQCGVDSVNV